MSGGGSWKGREFEVGEGVWMFGRLGVGGGRFLGMGQDFEVAAEGVRRGLEKLVVLRRWRAGSGGRAYWC